MSAELSSLASAGAGSKPQRLFAAVFAISLAATFARSSRLFLWPPLYCEDGLFFTHFYNQREVSEILFRYNGYVAFGPNLLAFVATFLPVRSAPYFLSGVALLARAFAHATFTLPRFREVVPSDGARGVIAGLLAVWPLGDFAMSNTGVYAIWNLLLLLILLSIAPVGVLGWGEGALVLYQLVAIGSHPLSLLLTPIWARDLVRDERLHARVVRATLIGASGLYFLFGVRHGTPNPFRPEVIEKARFLLAVRVFLEGLTGASFPVTLAQQGLRDTSMALGAALAVIPAVLVVVFRKRMHAARLHALFAFLALAIGIVWLSASTRPLVAIADLWGGRYYYVPQYLFLLFLMVAGEGIFRIASWPRPAILLLVFAVLVWSGVVLVNNRYAWWEQVPKDGRQVSAFLERVSEAERSGKDGVLDFWRGRWTLRFRIRR